MHFNCISKKTIFALFTLLNLGVLRGQDATANIDLDRDETLETGVFSNKTGVLLGTTKKVDERFKKQSMKLYKYSPDLKLQWTLPVKDVLSGMVYDAKNPDYVYLMPYSSGGYSVFTSSAKKEIYQVSPDGKLRTHPITKDDVMDEPVVSFCSANQYCEVWTKKKTEDELILIKLDNQSFKQSKSKVRLPKSNKDEKYGDWFFAGVSDSLVALLRHPKKEAEKIQVILVNSFNGEIVENFVYVPSIKNIKGIINCENSRYTEGVNRPFNKETDFNYNNGGKRDLPSAHGDIRLAPDGKSFYHFALVSFSGKTFKLAGIYADGYILSKLTLDGIEEWRREEKFDNEEMINNLKRASSYNNVSISLEDLKDNQSVSFEIFHLIGYSTSTERARIGVKYDYTGKILDGCYKGYKLKSAGFMQNLKSVANTVDDIYPPFMRNTAPVTKYIEQKQIKKARYTIFTDNGSHVLTISPTDERVIGLMYFKN